MQSKNVHIYCFFFFYFFIFCFTETVLDLNSAMASQHIHLIPSAGIIDNNFYSWPCSAFDLQFSNVLIYTCAAIDPGLTVNTEHYLPAAEVWHQRTRSGYGFHGVFTCLRGHCIGIVSFRPRNNCYRHAADEQGFQCTQQRKGAERKQHKGIWKETVYYFHQTL